MGVFRYFQFCGLPFCLSSVPFYFSLRSSTASEILEKAGYCDCYFPRRWSRRGADYFSAKIYSLIVHSVLLKSGFVPTEVKSLWNPVQIITRLGVILTHLTALLKLPLNTLPSCIPISRYCLRKILLTQFS